MESVVPTTGNSLVARGSDLLLSVLARAPNRYQKFETVTFFAVMMANYGRLTLFQYLATPILAAPRRCGGKRPKRRNGKVSPYGSPVCRGRKKSATMADRRRDFKLRGHDAEEMRKRREDQNIMLRRDERVASLQKRRQIFPSQEKEDVLSVQPSVRLREEGSLAHFVTNSTSPSCRA